ncbi:hypothetical protein KPSA1_01058 [Pseudomonas syringae pv. actinidiae]|uniref:Uncharacterized protein n=1 Tax=Pseudomonas syringae pv. actinidiae TaxID=103796 RepID=A0A2V0QB42_PSESF|nr:hypothetical protein KPSA1_01058 [Pseudomonas syringae pv. actinidiae]
MVFLYWVVQLDQTVTNKGKCSRSNHRFGKTPPGYNQVRLFCRQMLSVQNYGRK